MNIRKESTMIGATILVGALGLSGLAGAATSTAHTHSTAPQHSLVAAKTKRVAFKGSYSGTIAMLWSSSSVTATSLQGTGTGSLLGSSTLSGTGSSNPSSTCDPFSGSGTIKGGGSVIHFRVVSSSSQACAAGQSAPTSVTVKGVATVLSGTGKYVGAKGNLTVAGSFSIKSTTAGSSESDAFTATLKGTLTVKG